MSIVRLSSLITGVSALFVGALGGAFPLTASAAPFTTKAFWRGDALPADTFIQTWGHPGVSDYWPCNDTGGKCKLDISATRWDGVNNKWTSLKEGAPANFTNRDHVFWGVPFHSPVDGEVIACWRSIPDDMEVSDPDPAIADTPQQCRDLSSGDCLLTGNNVIIKTDDNHFVLLAHLQQNSVPFAVCPIPNDLVNFPMPFSGSASTCGNDGIAVMTSLATLLPGQPLPRVSKGDLIGRGGESGQSGGPHVHYEAGELTFPAGQICRNSVFPRFSEAWEQVAISGVAPTASAWTPLTEDILSIAPDYTTSLILFGDPVGPVDDLATLEVGSVPALALTPAGGATAFINAANKVETRAFTFDANGDFVLGASKEDLGASDVAISRTNSTAAHVVVAIRDSATKLTTIPYFVKAGGTLVKGTPRTEASAGVGQVVSTVPPTHTGSIVAIRNGSNAVSVISYSANLVAAETLEMNRLASAASPASDTISDVDIATVVNGQALGQTSSSPFKGVMTAEIGLATKFVTLRSWRVNAAGTSVTAEDDALVESVGSSAPFQVNNVDITVTGAQGREFVIVSMAMDFMLRVQAWEITEVGELFLLSEVDSPTGLQWVPARLSSARSGLQDMVLGINTTAGDELSLISFHVTPDGILQRVGTRDRQDLSISAVALDGRATANDLVVVPRDSTNQVLSLLHYRTNYDALR